MRRKGYIINGEFFKTKDAIHERVRSILYAYSTGVQVDGEDSALLLELLHNHPNAIEKIGCGVEAFEIRQESSISRCFYLLRSDGSTVNFSYDKLLSPPTRLAAFKDVCRGLIHRQIFRFKFMHFREHAREDSRVQCPITHKWVMSEETDVDHAPPNTFAKLVTDFIDQNEIDVENAKFQVAGKAIDKTFTDTALAENWVKYHDTRADLRVISSFANQVILPRLANHYELSLIFVLDPASTETLIAMALELIALGEEKEVALADLQIYATRLVGSNALHPLLRTAKYEEALFAFIDWLLPDDTLGVDDRYYRTEARKAQ